MEVRDPKVQAPETTDGMSECRIIAVDGSAAAGKSTVGKRLAAKLGYPFLDTGIMYRAMTVAALQRGLDLDDESQLEALAASVDMRVDLADPSSSEQSRIYIDGVDVTEEIRSAPVEEAVSIVSQSLPVRDAMVKLQRAIAGRGPVVMFGRDIGTVVLPGADLKLYLEASPEERARRRHKEFASLGRDSSPNAVHTDLERRDRRDSERAVSPLRPAEDARLIDTDRLSLDEVLREAVALVREAGASKR